MKFGKGKTLVEAEAGEKYTVTDYRFGYVWLKQATGKKVVMDKDREIEKRFKEVMDE